MNALQKRSPRGDLAAEPKPPITIAVAYADRLTYGIARTVYARLVPRIHRAFEIRAFWWSSDMLGQPSVLERAVTKAVAADMIVCSVRASEELPAPISAWANRWIEQTRDTNGALVALLKTAGPTNGAPLAAEVRLNALAEAAGMDFFVKVFDAASGDTASFDSLRPA